LVFGTTTGVVFRRRHRHSSSIRVGHDLSSGVSLLLDLCSGVFDLVLYTLLLLRATVNFFWQSQSSGGVIQTALLLLRSLFTVAIVVTILGSLILPDLLRSAVSLLLLLQCHRFFVTLSQLCFSVLLRFGSLQWFEFVWLEMAVYACCVLS
jgi:hypothetical protein